MPGRDLYPARLSEGDERKAMVPERDLCCRSPGPEDATICAGVVLPEPEVGTRVCDDVAYARGARISDVGVGSIFLIVAVLQFHRAELRAAFGATNGCRHRTTDRN